MANLIPSVPNPTQEATKTLVLAHRTELLEQAQKQIQRFNPSLRVSIEQGRRKVDVENTDVIVASVQTLGRAGSDRLDNYDPSLFKTIMIDEAHHAAASTYTRILSHFGATEPDSHVLIWGCSATVRRHDGLSLSNAFSDIAFHMDFLDMIESKWLSPLKLTTVETSVDLSNVGIQRQDFKQSELSQAVNVSDRNEIIVRSWRKYAQNDDLDDDISASDQPVPQQRKATLVFAVDIAHTLALCNHFRQNGYSAEYVTSKTPTLNRYDILDRFRKGKFPILVNCGILTEGTDIPSIDCVLMARPTRSAVLFQQMFGRGMRLSPGKKDCLVIDFVDNFKRSGLVTFPTLMGLNPETIIQDEDVLQLEQKALEADKQQEDDQCIADIPVNDDQNSTSCHLRLKITEYDTMQEFMTTCSGLDRHIRQISTNAWVTVGNQYALTILGKGLITISQKNDGNWIGTFQRQNSQQHGEHRTANSASGNSVSSSNSGSNSGSDKKQKENGKFFVGRKTAIPLEADTLVTAIQAADTWIRYSLLHGKHHSNSSSRFATYRSHPMTEKQRAILKKYKVDVQQVINKGQAMDLITRLKLGQGRIWRQQAEAKQKQIDSIKQQKQQGAFLRRTLPSPTTTKS
ncbi:P-loop containing nucleoside triphosphate hydrolase protein [Absidia repens]|uniref:p-loop containing nucleoside triphosphate hydrolase protein n=1 Tax=Absidia repens TaxID=90262 RepID=A0A1X2IBB6_9FUNG|nr:P-loop containing nucleoside triphosphate hydrolase protein [Absidia repens]